MTRTKVMIDPSRLHPKDADIALLAAVGVRAYHDARGQLAGVPRDERPTVKAEARQFLDWFRNECGINFEG